MAQCKYGTSPSFLRAARLLEPPNVFQFEGLLVFAACLSLLLARFGLADVGASTFCQRAWADEPTGRMPTFLVGTRE